MEKINLFIPDPHAPSSYYILYSLRKLCERIVIGIPKMNSYSGFFALSAKSRYVDKFYFTEDVRKSWDSGGNIEAE
ncbi:MAG: hypothetical protein KJ818_05740, partial [Candidatus Omnitrophica bacterium]|nr:hypothetical protein [Candidatus Omnitrophota bacterium]